MTSDPPVVDGLALEPDDDVDDGALEAERGKSAGFGDTGVDPVAGADVVEADVDVGAVDEDAVGARGLRGRVARALSAVLAAALLPAEDRPVAVEETRRVGVLRLDAEEPAAFVRDPEALDFPLVVADEVRLARGVLFAAGASSTSVWSS